MVSTSTKLFEGAFHVDAYLSAYGRPPHREGAVSGESWLRKQFSRIASSFWRV